jgi:hypothetical protein
MRPETNAARCRCWYIHATTNPRRHSANQSVRNQQQIESRNSFRQQQSIHQHAQKGDHYEDAQCSQPDTHGRTPHCWEKVGETAAKVPESIKTLAATESFPRANADFDTHPIHSTEPILARTSASNLLLSPGIVYRLTARVARRSRRTSMEPIE